MILTQSAAIILWNFHQEEREMYFWVVLYTRLWKSNGLETLFHPARKWRGISLCDGMHGYQWIKVSYCNRKNSSEPDKVLYLKKWTNLTTTLVSMTCLLYGQSFDHPWKLLWKLSWEIEDKSLVFQIIMDLVELTDTQLKRFKQVFTR